MKTNTIKSNQLVTMEIAINTNNRKTLAAFRETFVDNIISSVELSKGLTSVWYFTVAISPTELFSLATLVGAARETQMRA